MGFIELITQVNAPVEICFNLSRSAELHMISTSKTNERVVEGRSTGLFEKGETVTWRAKHFGVFQTLQMEISEMEFPFSFEDRMVKGIFKSICHNHYFTFDRGYTLMKDRFQYEVPFAVLGKIFDQTILKPYLTNLLNERNRVIKEYAESGKWMDLLYG